MNKKTLKSITIIILITLLIPSTLDNVTSFPTILNKIRPALPIYGMNVTDSTFEDGLYNGPNLTYPFEWYYFDSVLSDGFSVEFHVICGPSDNIGVVTSMINIYQNGNLLFHDAKYEFINKLNASNNMKISFNDQTIIKGHMNNQDQWTLDLNYTVDGYSIELQFTSSTKCWKAKVLDMWWWGVLIPNSDVKGTITCNNISHFVEGNGYVEHAWEGTLPFVWGWFWGKFVGQNYSIIWSQIYKNPIKRHIVMVLNELDGDYINIPYHDIRIILKDYMFHDGWIIPTEFDFIVKNEKIQVRLNAKAHNIIHQTSIVSFNYWRYHVNIKGYISYNGKTEHVNNMQIMDLTRFY
jgi:hypothetical protein